MDTPLYDTIGQGYRRYRVPDARIAAQIDQALGEAKTVLNVGAGAGAYEPLGRRVVAVEPSTTMIRQRAPDAAPVVQASAEQMPFADGAFDAAMAVLTVHHWHDWRQGLEEMRRVARTVVVLTWDPAHEGFWLVQDYFPEVLALDRTIFPTMADFGEVFGEVRVEPVVVPHDCTDGFLGAYWRRPQAYLDPNVRGAISSFSRLDQVEPRLERLADDLTSGRWHQRHGHLFDQMELDVGYRLVVGA
ncbi:MAG TPA: class I SAM-dependent methyltransferase [Rhodothermales bacterium]|nr:class I SAM-dependent methyltransferase [Rhodothermales bacterium]